MKEEYRGFTIEIAQDIFSEGPRTWDNLGTMVCWHRSYTLGDEQVQYFEDIDLSDVAVSLLLYLYDHGGITMKTTPFSRSWDSGEVGLVYVTRDEILAEYGGVRLTKSKRDRARRVLEAEVKVYDQFLTGDVYGYIVKDMDSVFDSCWGYYGYDYCLEEAKSIVDHHVAHERKHHIEQVKAWIRNKVPLIYRKSLDQKFSR